MEKRDYLMRQIHLMMQTLLALIRKITGLKEENSEEEIRQVTDTMLKEYLNTSLEEIQQLSVNEIVEFIVGQKGIHSMNIDLFAEILILNANTGIQIEGKHDLLLKALELLEWSDRESGYYSVDRHEKITNLKFLLEIPNP
jgi:hypothetical protein